MYWYTLLFDLSVQHYQVYKLRKYNHYKQYNKERCKMALLEIDNLTKNFQNGEVEEQVLKGIDLKLKKGKVSALVGASGSGKSTLLTIAAGLQPDRKSVVVGKECRCRSKKHNVQRE